MTNLVVMEQHLELVKVEPALGLPGLEVVVEVPRREAEGVELLVRGEEENCRRLLVVDTCHHHCHRHPHYYGCVCCYPGRPPPTSS